MGCNGMAFFPANFMLQTSQDQEDDDDNHHQQNQHHRHQQPPPIFPPQDFNGVAAFLGGKRSMPLMEQHQSNNGCEDNTNNNTNGDQDELSDDGSLGGDQKKRRLTMEQVKTLEKSFERGNKLEPERKVQLARALGLQPRQIAIWFQNRRARWKTKQLEKDYDALKRQFDAVKAHNEALQTQNQKLQSQILALTSGREGGGAATGVAMTESFNLNKETIDQGSCSNRSENSSDHQINMVKLDMSRAAAAGPASETSPSQIPTSMPLFPTSSSTTTTNSMRPASSSNLSATQLLFHHNHNPQQHGVKEENFSNMFCGIEDHSGFWPWLDQHQNFN